MARFYNFLDIHDFIEKRREDFEAVAPLPPPLKTPAGCSLWTASVGWGDADIDWSSIGKAVAERTKQWVGLLADFVALCREVRPEKFIPTVTVTKAEQNLRALDSYREAAHLGVLKGIEILPGVDCPSSTAQAGIVYQLESVPSLPLKDCAHPDKCQCCYSPVVKEGG